jgi:hypothetical protein
VVAPPKIVRPVVVAPAPIVDDASEYNPAIKPISVFVAFAAVAPKVVVVNGKANDAAADPVKHTPFIEKHPPARSIPRAKVEVAAVPVTFKYAVESPAVSVEVAGPVTYKDEVVAYEAKKLVEEQDVGELGKLWAITADSWYTASAVLWLEDWPQTLGEHGAIGLKVDELIIRAIYSSRVTCSN